MADIHFKCPECGKFLAVDRKGEGLSFPCPDCRTVIVVSNPTIEVLCPNCGQVTYAMEGMAGAMGRCLHCYELVPFPAPAEAVPPRKASPWKFFYEAKPEEADAQAVSMSENVYQHAIVKHMETRAIQAMELERRLAEVRAEKRRVLRAGRMKTLLILALAATAGLLYFRDRLPPAFRRVWPARAAPAPQPVAAAAKKPDQPARPAVASTPPPAAAAKPQPDPAPAPAKPQPAPAQIATIAPSRPAVDPLTSLEAHLDNLKQSYKKQARGAGVSLLDVTYGVQRTSSPVSPYVGHAVCKVKYEKEKVYVDYMLSLAFRKDHWTLEDVRWRDSTKKDEWHPALSSIPREFTTRLRLAP